MTADCPDYAFNEYLELGVEFGLAALLVLVVMLLIPLYISFKSRSIWCYGLLSLSIFAFFSYPLHIRQFQLLFPLILSACLSDAPSTYERNLIKYFGMLFLITIPVYVYPAINDLKPQIKKIEESKRRMEDVGMWSLNKCYELVAQECESLFPYLKNDKQYLLLYGEALSKNAEYDKSYSILLHGFNTSGDPAFLIMMGDNALEMQRYSDAKEKYKQAFYVIPNRIYPLYKIAVLYNEQCDTVRFMRMSNLIDDFIPKVESARTRRYREDIHQIKNSLLSATHD